jgi:hypothetical protein
MSGMPQPLRAKLAADYQPVRPLASPIARVAWLLPLAALTIAAGPVVFEVRGDATRLGWVGLWGASSLQAAIGLALLVAALREAIPGRGWNATATALWVAGPLALLVLVTFASWESSPTVIRGAWWRVGVLCFGGSLVSGLPIVALASVLAARAYATRPALAGALLGLGAGLLADAGWRVFCHFSEPAHVLSAHVSAVLMSLAAGSLLAAAICRVQRKS